jgi:hypothetical protein
VTQSYSDVYVCIESGTWERNCPSEAIVYVDEDEIGTKDLAQSTGHP